MALLEKDRKKRAEPLATQLIQIMLLFGIYRHNLQRLEKLKKLEQLNPLQKPIENIIKRVEHTGRDTPDDSNGDNSTKS